MKRLTKDRKNSKIFGVCAGIADYLDVDVTIIRLLWVIFACLFDGGIIAYLLAALILPES